MTNSILQWRVGRIRFVVSLVLAAILCVGVLWLLKTHAESPHTLQVAELCFVLIGVIWIRSLSGRLMDAGLPSWSFWIYFLIVFGGCVGAHLLKYADKSETVGLFLLLQLPAILLASAPLLSVEVSARQQAALKATRLGAAEFALYVALIAGLLLVLHLLRGDMGGMNRGRYLMLAFDVGSGIVCLPWYFSVKGRLNALGLMRWSKCYCLTVLAACLLPLYLKDIHFSLALALFAALQLPIIFLRREWIGARFFLVDKDI